MVQADFIEDKIETTFVFKPNFYSCFSRGSHDLEVWETKSSQGSTSSPCSVLSTTLTRVDPGSYAVDSSPHFDGASFSTLFQWLLLDS